MNAEGKTREERDGAGWEAERMGDWLGVLWGLPPKWHPPDARATPNPTGRSRSPLRVSLKTASNPVLETNYIRVRCPIFSAVGVIGGLN